jgi:hypothetical protein
MILRRIALASAPVFALLAVEACFSSSNNNASGPDGGDESYDAAGPDASTLGSADGALSGKDGATSSADTGAGADGGQQAVSDAGTPDGNPCGDAVRIDLGTGTLAADFVAAGAYQGAHVAVWPDDPNQVDASTVHLRARVFDGDAGMTDLGQVDPSGTATLPTIAFAVDGTGHAFAMWEPTYSSTTANQGVFSVGATLGAVSTTTMASGSPQSVALAPLSTGAITFHPAAPPTPGNYAQSYASEVWSAGGGWSATGLTTTEIGSGGATIHTSLSGKAVASWFDGSPASSGFAIHVIAFDGSAWATPVVRSFPSDGGANEVPGAYAYVVRSNGDAVFFLNYTNRVDVEVFVASTGTFQAPTTIAQGNVIIWFPSYNSDQWAAIDSADRITMAWPMYGDGGGIGDGQLYVSRNLGSGWSAPEALGATTGSDYKVVRDPSTDRVVAGADYWVRSIAATGTTWSPTGRLMDLPNRLGALTFDGTSTLVVHAAPVPGTTSGQIALYATRCAL